jgi:hypothetical protein
MHPVYDYGTPRSDYAQERILFIHASMIDARVRAHGLPPPNFDLQREWYMEALRDSLRVAAETKKVSHIKGKMPSRRDNTLALSSGSAGPSTASGMPFNVSLAASSQMPSTPIMNNNIQGMSVMPPTFHPGTQQHAPAHQWELATSMPGLMNINPPAMNVQFFDSPDQMADDNRQSFPTTYPYLEQGEQADFDLWFPEPGGT